MALYADCIPGIGGEKEPEQAMDWVLGGSQISPNSAGEQPDPGAPGGAQLSGSASTGFRRFWRPIVGAAGLAFIGLALAGGLHGKRPAAVVTPYPHELAQVTFAAAGDVIPHEAVRQAAAAAGEGEAGWAALFSDVADVFEGADFGFANLETPVAPEHSHGTKPFLFNAPVTLPEALKASGIKIVSFANNHVMDQGWAGFAESREHLKEAGLLFVGTSDNAAAAWQPVITEANGIKVGWLGMTRWLNGNRNPEDPNQPHVNFFPYPGESKGAPGADEATVLAAVKAARAQCDLLVISIHWGVEYATAPRPEDVDLAHKIMDAGASVIVGAHPHVLQPIETYKTQDGRNTVIFYSLGNFLSNQSRTYVDGLNPDSNGDPRDELIALFSAVRQDYGPAGVRVELGHVGVLPVWEENNRNEVAAGRAKTPVIRPELIDWEIPALQAKVDELSKPGVALTDQQKSEFIEVTKRLKLLTDRREKILARVGDEYVTAPPKLAPNAKPQLVYPGATALKSTRPTESDDPERKPDRAQ
jgi:poly-gamma-glutamate capsule biosynthesis protein CapA/YwtB (metallophosphatase superfamily)